MCFTQSPSLWLTRQFVQSAALRALPAGLAVLLVACAADLPADPTVWPKDAALGDIRHDVPADPDTDRAWENDTDVDGREHRGDRVDARVDLDASDDADDDDAGDPPNDGQSDVASDPIADLSLDTVIDVDSGDARPRDTGDGGFPGTPVDPRFYRFVRLAVIGDYGTISSNETRIANLVTSWSPDFVITTGDNNYTGLETGFDDAIGQFYSPFIGNYRGKYGPGSTTTRFWPSPGNHDWDVDNLGPYADYFTLPGNERYYDIALGLVHLFAIDSDPREPDGTTADSVQGRWLQDRLSKSTSCFNLVYFHHPGYSSGPHGSAIDMRWPFEAWGADAVLAGHDHVYERFEVGQIPYFTVGLGGASLYAFVSTIPESRAQFNSDFAAMRITATRRGLRFELIDGSGNLVESLTSSKRCR